MGLPGFVLVVSGFAACARSGYESVAQEPRPGDGDSQVLQGDNRFPEPHSLPCLQSCTPGAWNNLGSATAGNSFAQGSLAACMQSDGNVAVVVKDGSEARLRRVAGDGTLLLDTPLGLVLTSGDFVMGDISDLICLSEGVVLYYRTAAGEASLETFAPDGTTRRGPVAVVGGQAPTASIPAGAAVMAGDLYAFYAAQEGTAFRIYARRFDTSLAPLGEPILVTPDDNVNMAYLDVAARASDVAVVYSDTSSAWHVAWVTRHGEVGRMGPLAAASDPSQVKLASAAGMTAVCWATNTGSSGPTVCTMMDDAGVSLGPLQNLTPAGRNDGLGISLASDRCGFHLVSYCRMILSSCPDGGGYYYGDPGTASWTRVGLPPRTGSNDTVVGWLPMSTELLVGDQGVRHFGLNRSNAAGTTQLHQLAFACVAQTQ